MSRPKSLQKLYCRATLSRYEACPRASSDHWCLQRPRSLVKRDNVRTMTSNTISAEEFQISSTASKIGNAEDSLFNRQVDELKTWMSSSRFAGLKRPYSAEDVAKKRGSLPRSYPSSLMAQKLFRILQERSESLTPLHILGAVDPVQMTQQAQHQEALYVSGWACSSLLTTSNEVSPDFGDYPYNTVPNQVQRLFKAQDLHDRRQWDERRSMSAAERQTSPYIDYLRPIIADGDTGHGGLTAVMKLAKLFAENGAAAVHFEDQLHGGKKCGHLAGKVLVPVGDHINRLIAARFQWDLMGSENLLIARTDAESAKLISSAIDVRDHAFIKGVVEPADPLAEKMYELEQNGATGAEIDAFEANWVSTHKLLTYDEAAMQAMQRANKTSQATTYQDKILMSPCMPISTRRELAESLAGRPIFFSWDIPRTREGFYHYTGGIKVAVMRAQEYSAYADLLWLETGTPNVEDASRFARQVRLVKPDAKLVYNLSPSFNWLGQGWSRDELKDFVWALAKSGFVLQLISLAGLHSTATITAELSRRFAQEGMLAYVDLVQSREKALGVDVLRHQKWSGAAYVDGILGVIQSGSSGNKSMGKGNTEADF